MDAGNEKPSLYAPYSAVNHLFNSVRDCRSANSNQVNMMSTPLLQHGPSPMVTATALFPPLNGVNGCRVESSSDASPMPQLHAAASG